MAEHWVWGIDYCTNHRCMCVSVIMFFNTLSSILWSLPFTYRENACSWNYPQNSFPGKFKTEKELLLELWSLHKRFNIQYSPCLMFKLSAFTVSGNVAVAQHLWTAHRSATSSAVTRCWRSATQALAVELTCVHSRRAVTRKLPACIHLVCCCVGLAGVWTVAGLEEEMGGYWHLQRNTGPKDEGW